jgi:hypothetical protein
VNDDDVLTAVKYSVAAARDSIADVRMELPAEAIMARARKRRLRRGLAMTAAMASVLVLALTALVPGHGIRAARLAAWTVAEQPHGTVVVTIRELRDPRGLQRTLRADGVPATVNFMNQNPIACLYYPVSLQQLSRLTAKIFPAETSSDSQGGAAFTITTSAIPRGVGLWINVSPPQTMEGGPVSGLSAVAFGVSWALVYPNGRCPSP